MLNTHKLIYILTDLAYVVELLPDKKPHNYTIQSFKQINGQLIDGNKLLTSNLKKLISKIDNGEYHFVLPDQVFTNTIVNLKEPSETKVKAQLKDDILPDLGIKADSHLIQTFILAEHKGTYKVQISTVQKSLLSPLREALEGSDVTAQGVYPLSWTLKALISLEPSISLVQLGENLYLAKHYIGVDQPVMAAVDNTDRVVEAVKTFKGAEPSIQSLYLLSNELVEKKLKEALSDVLPIQQLAEVDEEETKVPSYVKQTVTASLKTISIEDFAIPNFELKGVKAGSSSAEPESESKLPAPSQPTKGDTDKTDAKEAEDDLEKEVDEEVDVKEEAADQEPEEQDTDAMEVEEIEEDEVESKSEAESESDLEAEEESLDETSVDGDGEKSTQDDHQHEPASVGSQLTAKASGKIVAGSVADRTTETTTRSTVSAEETDEVDLNQFVNQSDMTTSQKKSSKKPVKKDKKNKKGVVKNNDGIGNFLKVFFIGLASFSATVAIGIGIGLGVLQLSQSGQEQIEDPLVTSEEQLTPSPEPTATPTPLPEINREEISIKVVNATTQPGYAGSVGTTLEEAGYGEVLARNASDDYEEGFYLLAEEENQALLSALEADTGFEITFQAEKTVEDPQDEYDAVLVLAKQSE